MKRRSIAPSDIDAVLADNEYEVRSTLTGICIPRTSVEVVDLLFGEASPYPFRDPDWHYEYVDPCRRVDVYGLSGTPHDVGQLWTNGISIVWRNDTSVVWPDHKDHMYPLATDYYLGWMPWTPYTYLWVVPHGIYDAFIRMARNMENR